MKIVFDKKERMRAMWGGGIVLISGILTFGVGSWFGGIVGFILIGMGIGFIVDDHIDKNLNKKEKKTQKKFKGGMFDILKWNFK